MTESATEPGSTPGVPDAEAIDDSRLAPGKSLRQTAARGTLINSAFQIALSVLNVLQRVITAAFLTRAQYGLWGVIISILVNLGFLKNFGIPDKYIQQSEADQERAFQKAFTLELLTSVGFFLLVAMVLPLWALAYGHEEIIVPGIVMCTSVILAAFKAPVWIYYRRMQYARQRLLSGIDPVVTFVVTVALAIAGAGYWCFVGGLVAGSAAGALSCTIWSPYPLRLVFERGTVREYASFSWPLLGGAISRLLVVQGSLLVANHVVGLEGVGAIALATTFAVFADRVDGLVSSSIYPAVCAVAHRLDLMVEVFVKSNRVALIWAMPFGAGLALFADDLVTFALGDRWQPAVGLLAAFGLTCAVGQVAFNWHVFLRAMDNTRPLLAGAVANVLTFAVVSVPAMFAWGLTGYAAGFAASTLVQLAVRSYYIHRIFRGFRVLRQLGRAVAPTLPAVGLVLLVRLVDPADRTLAWAIAELGLYSAATILFTVLFERRLVAELVGYLRGRGGQGPMQSIAAEASKT
jgi:O-antigen/teichoic acid export membrane protein